MYNEYALKQRERHDRRVGNWHDKIDKTNPILKEKYEAACFEVGLRMEERTQAYGVKTAENEDAYNNFEDTYIIPAMKKESKLRHQYWCLHEHAIDEGEYLVCPDCGSVNFGLGWDSID